MQRIGIRFSMALGLTISSTASLYMGLVYSSNTIYPLILLGHFIMALGMSMAMTSATNSIMGAIPPSKSGVSSAMNDTTRELGNALGVAVLGTLLNSTYLSGVQQLKNTLPELAADLLVSISSNIQTAHTVAAQVTSAMGTVIVKTANTAFVHGMNLANLCAAAAMFGAAIFVMFTVPNHVQQTKMEQIGPTDAIAVTDASS